MLTHPLTSIHPLAYTHSTLLNITILLARRPYHWKHIFPRSRKLLTGLYRRAKLLPLNTLEHIGKSMLYVVVELLGSGVGPQHIGAEGHSLLLLAGNHIHVGDIALGEDGIGQHHHHLVSKI